ncbi:MAG: hypothetical protein ACREBA_10015 [Nitrosotalea sp.]
MQTKTVSHNEIERLLKEFKIYKRATDKEIRTLHLQITRVQKILEKSIIKEDSPDAYEIKAIKNFEARKSKEKFDYMPLKSLN